jgi:N-acetylneuraminate synthase
MNDIPSVKRSVEVIQGHGTPLALLHCTSLYPTPYNQLRLGAIQDLQKMFPDLGIGLSDHTLGIWTCLGAVSLGACILEKHFTISRSWPGPDTGMSVEPNELKDLVRGSRAVWEAQGGAKTILPEEQPVIDFAYATVVTIRPVRKGEIFSRDNVWVKRPGTGPILASRFDDVLTRTAARDVAADVHLAPGDISGFK